MKKLQNNFTTPEQSRRLLALGIPADSADCYFGQYSFMKLIIGEYEKVGCGAKVGNEYYYLPCWSTGRLIEIMLLCYQFDLTSCACMRVYLTDVLQKDLINILIADIERNKNKIDFSKLEEQL